MSRVVRKTALTLLLPLVLSTSAYSQVVSAQQRFVVHVPSRLSLELSAPTFTQSDNSLHVQQSVQVKATPEAGMVMAVHLQQPGHISRVQQAGISQFPNAESIQVSPGVAHIFDIPPAKSGSTLVSSRPTTTPVMFSSIQDGPHYLTLDMQFRIEHSKDAPPETLVTTFTSIP